MMLPEPVKRRAEEIARARASGAFPLALRVLEAYQVLSASSLTAETVDELHRMMVQAQPWMVAVRNASHLGRKLLTEGRGPAIPSLRERLLAARTKVARRAAKAIKDARTVLTLSYSTDVFEALKHHEGSESLQVYVCESRPLREGVQLVADLRKASVAATLIADAAGPTLVSRADAVVTGADSLLRRGSLVNKIGTLSLALACREDGVPFLPLLEGLKVELEGEEMAWEEEKRDPAELSSRVEALNFYFEKVPPGLLDVLITDVGSWSFEELIQRFRTIEDLATFYVE
jgi:translation initiation factor 2B subunit (eIF-2B alpha/beta/delta family)